MLPDTLDAFIGFATNNRPYLLLPVCAAFIATLVGLHKLGGRGWAIIYVAMIPFLNWSFGVVPNMQFVGPWALEIPKAFGFGDIASYFSLVSAGEDPHPGGLQLHPLTLITGLVFVIRDFVQREMKQMVLVAMAVALLWSMYYAWIVIVIASGLAFFVSEFFDWLLFTFSKMKLSKRILWSSAVATPIDTSIFLYGADLAKQLKYGLEAGNTFTLANWIVFMTGKMVGAVVVSHLVRRREDAGKINPYDDIPAQSAAL